jgi:hypothetical protein
MPGRCNRKGRNEARRPCRCEVPRRGGEIVRRRSRRVCPGKPPGQEGRESGSAGRPALAVNDNWLLARNHACIWGFQVVMAGLHA